MKLLAMLCFVVNACCYIHTSKEVMDKLYERSPRDDVAFSNLKSHLMTALQNGVQRLFESKKSPKGFESPLVYLIKHLCLEDLQ